MGKQTYRFTWQGIDIEAVYDPDSYGSMAHLAFRSVRPERAPLPITETGYRSHFHRRGAIEEKGGDVVTQVTAWLDEEASEPDSKNMSRKAVRDDCSDVSASKAGAVAASVGAAAHNAARPR